MNISSRKLSVTLLTAASALALSSAAWAQGNSTAPTETVVVTGSRVISDIRNSPTPLTVVTTEQLQATTPTDIPDALNKLPVFVGSTTARSIANASNNNLGNTLNLRNFGAQRTLVLFDGHRVVPSGQNGAVDIDTLPQMMMSRVDVVTGGASAVYGSDAVTGVVNFVLDKHFMGVKYNASAGIASHGYGATYQAGVAMGTDLFGGKGHIEGSLRIFNQDPVLYLDLPYGPGYYGTTGSTTNPLLPQIETKNSRNNQPATGLVNCGTGCAFNNQQFVAPGILGGFNVGTPTNTSTVNSGGDGGVSVHNLGQASLRNQEGFARLSYNLDDTTTLYVQGAATQAVNNNPFYDFYLQTGVDPNSFFKNNPFLPAATQAQLNTGAGNTFTVNKTVNNVPGNSNRGIDRALTVTVGADGTWMGNYAWDVYFTHGENRLAEDNIGNWNNARLLAAEDAVTNAAGQVVCYATTPAAGAAVNAAYAGCVPFNAFGLNSVSKTAFDYVAQTTVFHETNILDNVGASISGNVFDLPAGPIKVALAGEARWMSLEIDSPSGPPTLKVDCTGLRLCNTASPPTLIGSNVLASIEPAVTENVWEFSAEAEIPILKDMPLVQSFDANLAGRYTDYSASGAVQTWKIGLNWHVTEDLLLRGTTSVDIRAPTLTDLFGPFQSNVSGFNDPHTGLALITQVQVAGGNAALVPEVARTWTAGVVLTPTFIPDLTLSVDYYQIDLKNAIGAVNGGQANTLCENANGVSPFCALIVRPLPFSDRSPANFPTFVFSQALNAAYSAISGVDFEADYHFDLSDVMESLGGTVSLRELFSMQPVNESQTFAGNAFSYTSQAKARSTFFFSYKVGDWGVSIQDQWISGYKKCTTAAPCYYGVPRIKAFNTIDLTVDRKIDMGGSNPDFYVSVNNLFDAQPPLWGGLASNPGYSYPVPGGYPVLGRFFSIGVRGNL